MERRRKTYYTYKYEETEITLETKKVSTDKDKLSRFVAKIKNISREQTRISDGSKGTFGHRTEQQPYRKNKIGTIIVTIIIFLILLGPEIINGVVISLKWYIDTILTPYTGMELSLDQKNLIAEKVLDALILWIMNRNIK